MSPIKNTNITSPNTYNSLLNYIDVPTPGTIIRSLENVEFNQSEQLVQDQLFAHPDQEFTSLSKKNTDWIETNEVDEW